MWVGKTGKNRKNRDLAKNKKANLSAEVNFPKKKKKKKNEESGDCTIVATQLRQLHYSNNLSKISIKKEYDTSRKCQTRGPSAMRHTLDL